MLLKCTNSDRKVLISSKGNGGSVRGTAMRMTMATSSTMTPRILRKGFRTPSKRHPGKVLPGKLHSFSRVGPGKIAPGKKIIPRPHPPPCDNSNDSGFGFDQHVEIQNNNSQNQQQTQQQQQQLQQHHHQQQQQQQHQQHQELQQQQVVRTIPTSRYEKIDGRKKDLKKFLSTASKGPVRAGLKRPAAPAQSNVSSSSKDNSIQLEIVSQPEQQHRARYQTEGSRGAVKDRSGNGFPIVKLSGYNKTTVLQVFIGTDIGRVAPHMFYQACKVAGKNSTPCSEKKLDGTMIIEIDFKPENDMIITCDCVGILKERNVDVEHRFPEHSGQRSKKKSTRCRMVFRTQLAHDDGTTETLQVCSYPIICTQPPGVPEICKKSLNSCPVDGGLELFIIGKNFLKDTCVVFRDAVDNSRSQNDINQIAPIWEEAVFPDKEYLQQTHLVCTVPPYIHQTLVEPVPVHLFIMSSGKRSESHTFMYTPKGAHSILSAATTLSTLHSTLTSPQDGRFGDNPSQPPPPVVMWGSNMIEPKHELDSGMMPPPTTTIPLGVRRASGTTTNSLLQAEQIAQINALKTEIMDESSQSSTPESMQTDSLDQFPVQNENSLDASPMKDMQQFQRIRKQSVDLCAEMHPITSMLSDNSNLVPSAPPSNFSQAATIVNESMGRRLSLVDLQVKQEQAAIASQLQSQILSAAAVAAAAVQGVQNVEKFFPAPNLTDIKPPVAPNDSLFVNNLNAGGNSPSNMGFPPQSNLSATGTTSGVMAPTAQPPSQTEVNAINEAITAAAVAAIADRTLSQTMLTNSNSPPLQQQTPQATLSQMLNLSQSDSPNSVRSPSSISSTSSSNGLHSPITQDIILNSEPAASIQSANMQSMLSAQPTNPTAVEHITSELILNPTVSPSVMCTAGTSSDPNNLIVNPVTMANTILNEMSLPSQTPQDNLLNEMLSNPPQTVDQMQVGAGNKSTSTDTTAAVNNIIFKAAADFLTNQERNNMATESTLNALMSMNSNSLVASVTAAAAVVEQQQQQQQNVVTQILNMQSSPTSSLPAGTIGNGIAQLNSNGTLRSPQSPNSTVQPTSPQNGSVPQQQQSPMSVPPNVTIAQNDSIQQQIAHHFNDAANVLNGNTPLLNRRDLPSSNVTATDSMNSLGNVPLSNLLLSEVNTARNVAVVAVAAAAAAAAQNDYMQNLQKANHQISSNVTSTSNPESLINATVTQSELQKSKIDGTVQQMTISQTTNMGSSSTPGPQSTTTTATIPQEITTMSDQDLISYINPSTFDQV